MSEFIQDVERIRAEARKSIESGPITTAYRANVENVLRILDASLATEWVCVLRYTQHAQTAQGIHSEAVAAEFAQHAKEELEHATSLGERIRQLGGTPRLDPATLTGRAHSQYKEADNLIDMIKENLVAERIAIESYTEAIRYIGDGDPTTRRLLESILAREEEHADDMSDLLAAMDPKEKFN